ncbi:MAG: OmpA family protein [Algoriphagus sp.]|jgi:OmpA-OmpF porin, OOP family|uniref:OmpA family protein n=1 Tax=Algoriphagus sp. TaxID=1872435 RepID=UPI0026213640|nr:OmpA family protein [Algoriphagus sp.]MDG1279505.1 OmpA family protein [Algoriphagus sp.]
MRHLLLFLSIVFISNTAFSQKDFNKWSIDANLGVNKPMGPLTGGYLSPTLNIGHVDFGGRYMVNQYFGFSGNFGFGSFSEAKDVSPEFKTDYLSLSLRGVWNIGRSLSFETFTKRFTVLGEFGAGFGSLKSEDRINSEGKLPDFDPDYVYSFNSSLKGLYSLSNRISLQGTISMIVNGRQRYTFDGNDFNQIGRPFLPEIPFPHATATWWTGTIGLNFYLGKNETHADWFIEPDKYASKEELTSNINEIKDMLKDSDGDGVPDYLDKEPNTPAGARVNSFGVTMDSDGDGTPDHLDNCPFLPGPSSTGGCPVEKIVEQVDFLIKAINDGYVNVYYAFDSDKPLAYSTSAANYVSNFLKKNPGVSVEVKGYADELGPEDYNMKLSERRAKAVYDLLISSGVDPSRISYKGYGEDTSVDKSSADARQMARRASFEVK